jgi:hypothetical protein
LTSTVYAESTQVIIIGTIHSAHFQNPNFSPEKLREIILSLRPDVILNELPLSLVEADGRPIAQIRGKDESGSPESWAADTAATQLGIKQIPYDRPDRQENFKKTKYFEKQKEADELRKLWFSEIENSTINLLDNEIKKVIEYNEKAEWEIAMKSNPEIINSDALDSISRME